MSEKILVGISQDEKQIYLNPSMVNRHGLIAGATGTGKTVTLQILTEAFSKLGIPVFTADVKGDLAGLSKKGALNNKIQERIDKIGIASYANKAFPSLLWDLYGKKGHPVRTTISDMGPVMLSRLLDLNDTQEGILQIAFKYADDEGLLLLDLKDLQELLKWLSDNSSELKSEYGNIHPSSVAAIQRDLLVIEQSGGTFFFGEPALKLSDFMKKDFSGNGVVSILDATKLLRDRKLYSTFLLWFLSELFEELEEVGDKELPKLVFFFDEAHLLFNDAPKALIEKIETVIRLIRSKGVGIFFVTQSPSDIPVSVLGQLGNRFQHALRAFTPADQKTVKVAAQTFRENPSFSTQEAITNLSVGEALVSVLDEKGAPTPVERTLIRPPESRMGPITDEERSETVSNSPINGLYEEMQDRESAYEIIKKRFEEKAKEDVKGKKKGNRQGWFAAFFKSMTRSLGSAIGRIAVTTIIATILGKATKKSSSSAKSAGSKVLKSVSNSIKRNIGNQIGKKITRGVLGSILK